MIKSNNLPLGYTMLAVVVIFTLFIAGLMRYIPNAIQTNAEKQAFIEIKGTIESIILLRELYAENLQGVDGPSLEKLEPYFRYKSLPKDQRPIVFEGDIRAKDPFPVEMIHKLTKKLSTIGIEIKLYSPKAFYSREDPILTNKQLETWEMLNQNPNKIIQETIFEDGNTIKQVAMADRLSSKKCLECHNRYDEGYEKTWELNDVRSVIVARKSIQPYILSGEKISRNITVALTCMFLLMVLLGLFIIRVRRHLIILGDKASHDQLTGLFNKQTLLDKISNYLKDSSFNIEESALFYIDLDGFKLINDTYGHDAGDFVLKTISSRFNTVKREKDIIARLGGDEFGLFLTKVEKSNVDSIANRIIDTVTKPIVHGDKQYHISCSMGIVLLSSIKGSIDPVDLLDKADKAMYTTKKGGKAGYHLLEDG